MSRIARSTASLPAALALAAVAACTTVEETYGPSGNPAYTLECSGTALSWGDCYAKAGKICKERGYDITQRSDERGGIGGATAGAGTFSAYGGSLHFRSMTIECR